MKYPILTTAIAAIALASTPAIGKNKGKHKGHDKHDRVVVVDRDDRYDRRGRVIYVDDRGNNPKAHGRHDNGLHLGWYKQRWQRGERIPVAYLEPRADWASRRWATEPPAPVTRALQPGPATR